MYIILLFIACMIVYYWKYGRVFYYGSKFDGPFAWPIFGNVLEFAGKTDKIIEVIGKWMGRYKSPMRVYFGNMLNICITKPEHLQIILNAPQALHKSDIYDFTKVIVGNGLITAPVHTWKRNRKLMLPVFNIKILASFVEVFSRQAEAFSKKLESHVDKGHFDMYPELHQATLAMICETNLGVHLDDQPEGAAYTKAFNKTSQIITVRIIRMWLHLDVIFNLTSMSRSLYKYSNKMLDFSRNVISQRKEFLKCLTDDDIDTAPRCRSFLDRLLELSKKEADIFPDQQILDEVNTIALAGSETSASASSFALVLLGMHQDIQDMVYEELQDVFKNEDRPVEHEDLSHLEILERVIKETLRLFPTVPVFERSVVEDINLGSHLVPKDCVCVISPYYIHRSPELWEDPLKFDPDRFLPENVAKRHPYSYLPFSAGPRNCIGFMYAMYSMKSILSTILRKYQVFTTYKSVEEIKVLIHLSMKTENGHMVALKKRTNQ